MPELVQIEFDGEAMQLPVGQSLAAALANRGVWSLGSEGPQARQVICAMGACFGCRVRIDGRSQRACTVRVRAGMKIQSEGVAG